MKPDLEYFRLAMTTWCKNNRWNKDLPITPAWLLEILSTAQSLKDADRKKLEETTA
jgi:Uma2 family endonuclease